MMLNKVFSPHHFSGMKFTQTPFVERIKKVAGFTLIELVIVILVVSVLLVAIFKLVNPAKHLGEARNAQRWSDITSIMDAFTRYAVDNNGTYVTSTTSGTTYYIGNTASTSGAMPASCAATTTVDAVDLHWLVSDGYIGDIPDDPNGIDNGSTDYYFYRDDTGKIIIGACDTYNNEIIKIIK